MANVMYLEIKRDETESLVEIVSDIPKGRIVAILRLAVAAYLWDPSGIGEEPPPRFGWFAAFECIPQSWWNRYGIQSARLLQGDDSVDSDENLRPDVE